MAGDYEIKPTYVESGWTAKQTPEERARSIEMCSKLNRCPHGVNVVMRRCEACEREGINVQPAGPQLT